MNDQATVDAAERALAKLEEMSLDLRACAILDVDGRTLATSADADWRVRAAELWEAAGGDAAPAPTQVHVATVEGEVFLVRGPGGRSAIAVTDRFALASLMFCDLRATLRELDSAAEPAAAGSR